MRMWLLLALLNPFLFAVTQFIDKYLIDKKVKDPWFISVLGGIVSFTVSVVVTLFHGFHLIHPTQILFLLLAGAALTYYMVPYFIALSSDDTSNVTPLFQFVAVFVLILSYLFLKEVLSGQQLFAFVLLFFGGLFLAANTTSKKGFISIKKSFWLMMLASLIASTASIFFKLVSIHIDFLTTIIYVNFGIGLSSFSLLLKPSLRKGFIKEVKRISLEVWIILAIDDLLNLGGELALLLAVSLAPASLVNAFGAVQPLYILLLGITLSLLFPRFVKENLGKGKLLQKIISIAMLMGGIYLLYI